MRIYSTPTQQLYPSSPLPTSALLFDKWEHAYFLICDKRRLCRNSTSKIGVTTEFFFPLALVYDTCISTGELMFIIAPFLQVIEDAGA
jgi:hypothetical protein